MGNSVCFVGVALVIPYRTVALCSTVHRLVARTCSTACHYSVHVDIHVLLSFPHVFYSMSLHVDYQAGNESTRDHGISLKLQS